MDPKIHIKGPDRGHAEASWGRSDASGQQRRTAKALLSEIRQLLESGEIREAKRLASNAARGHPTDPEIRELHRTLNVGRSLARPGTGRDMRSEYDWLRDPPKKYRGRWVALIGDAVVASAKTLQELQASLPADLGQTPLAVEVPA